MIVNIDNQNADTKAVKGNDIDRIRNCRLKLQDFSNEL